MSWSSLTNLLLALAHDKHNGDWNVIAQSLKQHKLVAKGTHFTPQACSQQYNKLLSQYGPTLVESLHTARTTELSESLMKQEETMRKLRSKLLQVESEEKIRVAKDRALQKQKIEQEKAKEVKLQPPDSQMVAPMQMPFIPYQPDPNLMMQTFIPIVTPPSVRTPVPAPAPAPLTPNPKTETPRQTRQKKVKSVAETPVKEEVKTPAKEKTPLKIQINMKGKDTPTSKGRTPKKPTTPRTASPTPTKRTRDPSTASKDSLLKVWKSVNSHRFAAIFRYPVTREEAPDYHDIIKNPMDLETIKSQIEDGTIATVNDIQEKLQLIFANAKIYNPPGDEIYKATEVLEAVTARILEPLLAVDESEPRKKRRGQ